MARKQWFKDYKIRDLTKWLNLTDYSSKIWDEQCLVCNNWNIEWNKLVTTKWKKLIYAWNGSSIQWLTKDGNDLYYIKNNNIYKNWNILYSWTYNLSVTTIDWYVFWLDVDWIKYITKIWPFSNETTAKATLLTTLQTWFWAWYTITQPTAWNYHIVNNAWTSFTVSNYSLWKVVENPTTWDVSMKADVVIDTTTINILPWVYTNFSDVKTYIVSQLPSWYYTQYLSSWLLITRDDTTMVTITVTNMTTYTYWISYNNQSMWSGRSWSYTDTSINWIVYRSTWTNTTNFYWSLIGRDLQWFTTDAVSWFNDSSQYNWYSEFTANSHIKINSITKLSTNTSTLVTLKTIWWTTIWTATFVWNVATFSSPITLIKWDVYSTLLNAPYNAWWDWIQSEFVTFRAWSGYRSAIYSINVTTVIPPELSSVEYWKSSWYDTVWNSSNYSAWYYIWYNTNLYLKKSDYSSMSVSTINHYSDATENSLYSNVTTQAYTSTINTSWYTFPMTITNNSLWLQEGYLYSLYKSPYWLLLVSQKWTSTIFIWLTGTVTNLSTTIWVGNPTVWVIYKWKIILWWYDWQDGIVFSKTADLITPENIIVFSWYNSNNQSVSSGNTWVITWMIISENWLYVFKDWEIWLSNKEYDAEKKNIITGTVEWTFNFLFDKVTSNGCMSNLSIATWWQNTFYFDYKNRAMRVLQQEQNYTWLRDNNISKDIEPILRNIPDDTTSIIYSKLINVNYSYPYLELSFPDENATDIYKLYPTASYWYALPNKTYVYNVISWGWYEKDEYDNIIISTSWYYWDTEWNIYKSNALNILKQWEYLSWELKLTSDIEYKKLWSFYVSWDIEGEKTLSIELLKDWENVVIWNEITPTQRIISWPWIIWEKIDLYEQGIQKLQYKLMSDDWDWKINISEVGFTWSPDNSYSNYY